MSFGFSSTTGGAAGVSGGEQEPRAQPGLDVFFSAGLAIDIAYGALYLACEEGRFINSHDLVIDGGRTNMFHEPPPPKD